MNIVERVDLTSFNTFGVQGWARYFLSIQSEDDFKIISSNKEHLSLNKLYLGGGSNILFVKPFEGLVLKNDIKGISIIAETNDSITLKVGAGEIWNDFVISSLNENWYGLENLTLIPGSVGASPIQNIGAYGVEVSEFIEKVECYDFQKGEFIEINREQCQFRYRESVFKKHFARFWFVTNVFFKLSKIPKVKDSYISLSQELKKSNIDQPTPVEISKVVSKIRNSKLPDPKVLGNAGSFFKNQVISKVQFEKLKKEFPQMVVFPVDESHIKISSGWLIESCGLKGYREGACGVHNDQALVLVNYGGARGEDIWNLSQKIIQEVYQKFNLILEPEVNIIK